MNDRALEYEYLNNLCAQYNLPRIRLRIITNNDIVFDEYLYNVFALHPGHRACFVSEDPYGLFEPIIFIRDDLLDQIFENALRHEFRHYWQYIYHKELYNWWNNHRKLYNNERIRNNYNVLEQDAYAFAFRGTTSTIDQSQYTIEWLNKNINFLYSLLSN